MAALSFLFTATRSPGATPPAAVGDLGCQRDVAYGRAAPCSPVDPPGAAGQILSGFALASCSSRAWFRRNQQRTPGRKGK